MDVQRKLEILADAAKYDASCASSGTEQRDSRDAKGLGSTAPGMGICHSYAPDGRCISLLKILLTNACNTELFERPELTPPLQTAHGTFNVPAKFVELAQSAILHRDPQ